MQLLDKGFFYSARIGFEIEFYSKFTKEEIAEKLGAELGKNIKVFNRYHSRFKPTSNVFKLESDFSGGIKMMELVTGPMNYFEAIPLLIRILKWVDLYGYTDEKCAFQFGLDFDREKYPLIVNFKNLNPLKFVLGIDEEYIWKKFPDRKGNIYAKSVKRITPVNKFVKGGKDILLDRNSYTVHTEKNMGVNLLKLEKGYMEVRYIGGKDYQKKYTDIKDIIDYIISYTFDVLKNNDTFTPKELNSLQRIIDRIYKSSETFLDPDTFMQNYPDFLITVDLRNDPQIIRSYFNSFKEVLYHLIVDNGITKGFLNYDSQIAKYQLKDGMTKKANLIKDLDLIDCEISGNITGCRIFGSILTGCQIEDSSFVSGNDVEDSKTTNCDLNAGNTFINCYIDAYEKDVNCKVEGGIIRSGYIGKQADISSTTEVVTDLLDAKGKKDKMTGRGLFPDRNYDDADLPIDDFSNMNDKKGAININKIYPNRNF